MPYVALDPGVAAAAPSTTIGDPVTGNGLTLLQMDNELHLLLMRRNDVDSTRRRFYINEAYKEFLSSIQLVEAKGSLALDIVADQPFYLLPSAVFAVTGASWSETVGSRIEGRPLAASSESAYRQRPISTAKMEEYFHYKNMIVFWSTPQGEGNVVVDFIIRPTPLTQNNHCPFVPPEWHMGILKLAKSLILTGLQEWDAGQIAMNDYVDFVRRKINPATIEDSARVMRSSVPMREAMLQRSRFPWRDE